MGLTGFNRARRDASAQKALAKSKAKAGAWKAAKAEAITDTAIDTTAASPDAGESKPREAR